MTTINNNNTSLEPNDLWYTLKESQDVGSATTIDRFDLESFIDDMLNMDNNGQFYQKLLHAEPANIDPCHRSLILKFVDLLDSAGYSVEKMSGTKRSVHIGQFSTDHVIAAAHVTCSLSLEASHMAVWCRSFSADANRYDKGKKSID
ncbi:unnamed protein product [Adineta steineri]|uniref:Uncharacterized protein n=1 Tax=Adineta steineri TaxID=433720 RepID=A0A815HFZ7_9BILA|nr:unnamed protein product [Adineta steineri]